MQSGNSHQSPNGLVAGPDQCVLGQGRDEVIDVRSVKIPQYESIQAFVALTSPMSSFCASKNAVSRRSSAWWSRSLLEVALVLQFTRLNCGLVNQIPCLQCLLLVQLANLRP